METPRCDTPPPSKMEVAVGTDNCNQKQVKAKEYHFMSTSSSSHHRSYGVDRPGSEHHGGHVEHSGTSPSSDSKCTNLYVSHTSQRPRSDKQLGSTHKSDKPSCNSSQKNSPVTDRELQERLKGLGDRRNTSEMSLPKNVADLEKKITTQSERLDNAMKRQSDCLESAIK